MSSQSSNISTFNLSSIAEESAFLKQYIFKILINALISILKLKATQQKLSGKQFLMFMLDLRFLTEHKITLFVEQIHIRFELRVNFSI